MNILLSIIVPIYNSENYLKACLDSIIKSKNKNLEILLINDGSTDSSLKICQEYKLKDSRIKIIDKKNSGVSLARNDGIINAIGEYVMFVDSDDVLFDGWDSILSNKCLYDIVYCSDKINLLKDKTDIINAIIYSTSELKIGGPYSKLFRTEFLRKNNIFFDKNIIYGEDMIFNLKALLYTDNIGFVCKSFYGYRINIISTTKRFNSKIIFSVENFLDSFESIAIDLNIDNIEKVIYDTTKSSVLLILNSIGYIKKYSEAKKYFNIVLTSNKLVKFFDELNIQKLKLKEKFIFLFLKHRLFYLIYLVYKINNNRKFRKKVFTFSCYKKKEEKYGNGIKNI